MPAAAPIHRHEPTAWSLCFRLFHCPFGGGLPCFPALNLSPLIYRELSLALRGRWSGPFRFLVPGLALAAAFVLLFLSRDDDPRKLGGYLFNILILLGLGHILVSTRGVCGRFFTQERRDKTLGLLFLTRLGPAEIMLGKATGVALSILYPLLGILPGLAVSFLMGGIGSALLGAAITTLFALLALALSLKLMTSVLCEDENAAETFADVTLLVLALGIPGLSALNEFLTGTPLDSGWLVLSPAYGPWQLLDGERESFAREIQLANGIASLYALLFLVLAYLGLKRAWRDEVEGTIHQPGSLRARLFDSFREWQRRRARNWLEANPYSWLLARDSRPALLSWGCVLFVLALWVIGLWHWTAFWLIPLNFWATSLILSASVQLMIHYLAAKQIAEDRKSGGLELILTSGLSVEEILSGQEQVIRRHARPLQFALGLIMAIFFMLGLFTREWSQETFASYFGLWVIVAALGPWATPKNSWNSFWLSLNTGRTGYAFRKGFWQQAWALILVFQLYVNRDSLSSFPTGDYGELALVWFLAAAVPLVMFFTTLGDKKKEKVAACLRRIAQEPIPDPADPRLKKWDGHQPFSWEEEPEEKILV